MRPQWLTRAVELDPDPPHRLLPSSILPCNPLLRRQHKLITAASSTTAKISRLLRQQAAHWPPAFSTQSAHPSPNSPPSTSTLHQPFLLHHLLLYSSFTLIHHQSSTLVHHTHLCESTASSSSRNEHPHPQRLVPPRLVGNIPFLQPPTFTQAVQRPHQHSNLTLTYSSKPTC